MHSLFGEMGPVSLWFHSKELTRARQVSAKALDLGALGVEVSPANDGRTGWSVTIRWPMAGEGDLGPVLSRLVELAAFAEDRDPHDLLEGIWPDRRS